jgi:hypothetical protein
MLYGELPVKKFQGIYKNDYSRQAIFRLLAVSY